MKFTDKDIGKRVALLANEAEGWPHEEGTIIAVEEECPGMLLVEIDEKYMADEDDDGIREVHEESVELCQAAQ